MPKRVQEMLETLTLDLDCSTGEMTGISVDVTPGDSDDSFVIAQEKTLAEIQEHFFSAETTSKRSLTCPLCDEKKPFKTKELLHKHLELDCPGVEMKCFGCKKVMSRERPGR